MSHTRLCRRRHSPSSGQGQISCAYGGSTISSAHTNLVRPPSGLTQKPSTLAERFHLRKMRTAAFSAAVTSTEPLARTAAAATAGATTDMFFHATLARTFISALRIRGDDDVVDRLNYYYTPIMLAIACLVVSAKQFGGSPIECWVNPHSRESMEEYIEAFCWIQNTYWVPMYEHIPDNHETREDQQISYYQWVPFILIAQALMFSLPCILWRLLNWQNGTNIQHLISAACDARSVIDMEERERVLNSVAATFVEMLDMVDVERRPHPSASILARLKPTRLLNGHLVCSLYLLIKLFYSANILLQFALLNTALTSDDHFLFGFQVLSDLYSGKPWAKSGHFPRVTLCDFEVRYLANLNRYTVQCALLINIINEKVFAFFWLWYCLLLCATTCSTLFWLTNSLLHAAKVDYVLKFMQIAEHNERIGGARVWKQQHKLSEEGELLFAERPFRVPSAHALDRFVDEFLKSDGLFVLRMVASNAGELMVVGIVRHLWREFASRQYRIRPFMFENELNDEREQQQYLHHYHRRNSRGGRGVTPEDCLLGVSTGNGPVGSAHTQSTLRRIKSNNLLPVYRANSSRRSSTASSVHEQNGSPTHIAVPNTIIEGTMFGKSEKVDL